MKAQSDEEEFNNWVETFFDMDPMMLAIVYRLFQANKDKRTKAIGIIVEIEPQPIEDSEIANLALFLLEKGLQLEHKRDTM